MAETTCPVLRPNAEEFEDFEKYIESIDELLEENGVVKVIPPAGWHNSDYNWREWDLQVNAPILQLASGRAGVYHVDIVEAKSMPLVEFEKRAKQQQCEENSYARLERKFWKSLGIASVGEPPMYGADMVGSVFGDDCTSTWNLSHLSTILKLLGDDLPGITNSMLYAGMWRAMFAFHVEDMDLYSINYVHFGASKSWYAIPSEYAERFETLANSYFPELYQSCKEYLRHKVVMISPSKLKEHGIPYRMVVQEAGEFVITSPKAYHAGYNHGFNLAEATNFATERWLQYGRNARVCKCRPFCVSIDMDYFETKYRRLQKQKMFAGGVSTTDQSVCTIGASADEEVVPHWQVHGWNFSCVCGVRCTDVDHPSKHPIGEQFECTTCGIWCHVSCVYGDGSSLDTIPELASCAICMTIDDIEGSGERPNSRNRRLSSTRRDPHPRQALRPDRKRPRRRTPKTSFQKGCDVYVHFIDGSWEPGSISAIEDGAAKVILQVRQKRATEHPHKTSTTENFELICATNQKPRKGRDREQWLSLQSTSLVLKEERDAESNSEITTSSSRSRLPPVSSMPSNNSADAAGVNSARSSRKRRMMPVPQHNVGSTAHVTAATPLPSMQRSPQAMPTFVQRLSQGVEGEEESLLFKLMCDVFGRDGTNADGMPIGQTLTSMATQFSAPTSLDSLQQQLLHPHAARTLAAMLMKSEPLGLSWNYDIPLPEPAVSSNPTVGGTEAQAASDVAPVVVSRTKGTSDPDQERRCLV